MLNIICLISNSINFSFKESFALLAFFAFERREIKILKIQSKL